MSTQRCEKTDLLVTDCSHCRGLDEPKPERGPTIAARFDGNCWGCVADIAEGDPIAFIDGKWVCAECAE